MINPQSYTPISRGLAPPGANWSSFRPATGGNAFPSPGGAGVGTSPYQQALADYNRQLTESQRRAATDRTQMLAEIERLRGYTQNFQAPQVQNPYTPQWFEQARAQQEDERGRQLQSSEAAMVQHYQQLGKTVDPRVLAMMRNTVMQQGNADTRDLQIGAAGNSFNASVAQNNAQSQYNQMLLGNQSQSLQMLYNVLNNTQYGPDPNQLALIMQLGQQSALAPGNVGGSYGGYTPPPNSFPSPGGAGVGAPSFPFSPSWMTAPPVPAPTPPRFNPSHPTVGAPGLSYNPGQPYRPNYMPF